MNRKLSSLPENLPYLFGIFYGHFCAPTDMNNSLVKLKVVVEAKTRET